MDKKKRYIDANRPVRHPGFAQDNTPHERNKGPDFNMVQRQKLVGRNVRSLWDKFGLFQKTAKMFGRQILKKKPKL